MTSPIHDPDQPKAESFIDWFHVNSRIVTIGGGVVVVAAFVFWFMQRTAMNETINSDKQLLVAKQSLSSGNAPLAEADLKKVYDKYGSKPAGAEAGLLIGQLRLEKGDNQGALTFLQAMASKVGDGPAAASVGGLLGDALEQLGKTAEAAAQYEKAAGLTKLTNEKTFLLSKAGRAYLAAGKRAEAQKVFEGLANQSDNPALATEARVRLGELAAGNKA
ncbi:MAG: tetratricopeptide repeat protein [Gemmatimonadota bacterium]